MNTLLENAPGGGDPNQLNTGNTGSPEAVVSTTDKYYQKLTDALTQDLKHTAIRHYVAWFAIFIFFLLLGLIICNSYFFWSHYLEKIEASQKVPSEKVVIAYLTISAAKIVGLVTAIGTFLFRGYSHQPVPKKE